MSQYYRPRQQHVPSSVSGERERGRALRIGVEDFVYVFPTPSSSGGSGPSSPAFGSDISAPTDLTLSSLSVSQSRDSSNHGSVSRTRSIGRMPTLRRPFSVGVDGDLELDWADMDSMAVSDENVVDSEEIDRAHRWSFLVPRRSRRDRVSSTSLSSWRARQQQLNSPTSRTTSVPRSTHWRHHNIDSKPRPTVYCQKRIQMLSFIASLLFIDESTIRLLTQTSSNSALFLGHSISDSDKHLSDEPDVHNSPPHGIIKLHSDENRTLKDGLAVAFDPDLVPRNPFALPDLRPSSLWGLVNGMWTISGRL